MGCTVVVLAYYLHNLKQTPYSQKYQLTSLVINTIQTVNKITKSFMITSWFQHGGFQVIFFFIHNIILREASVILYMKLWQELRFITRSATSYRTEPTETSQLSPENARFSICIAKRPPETVRSTIFPLVCALRSSLNQIVPRITRDLKLKLKKSSLGHLSGRRRGHAH